MRFNCQTLLDFRLVYNRHILYVLRQFNYTLTVDWIEIKCVLTIKYIIDYDKLRA